MPQQAYTLECGPKPWAVGVVSGTVCTVQVADPAGIGVIWADGTTTTIKAGTQAALLTGNPAVDTGANVYLIVAQQGSTGLTLVRLADALSVGMDHCLLPVAPSWGIVGELTHNRVREHPQMGDSGGSGSALPAGTEGAVLEWHNGGAAWLPIGPADSVLTSNGTDPAWTPDADLPVVIPMAHDDAVVGIRREISLNDAAGHVVIAAADDPAGNKVDYNFDLSANLLAAINASANIAPVRTAIYSTVGAERTFLPSPATANYVVPTDGAGHPWYTAAFDDSGWQPSVAATSGGPTTPIAGTQWVAHDTGDQADAQVVLFRRTFTLPAGSVLAAQFTGQADNYFPQVWINGTAIGGLGSSSPTTITSGSLTIPNNLIVPGGTNLLAIAVSNAPGSHPGNPISVDYTVAATTSTNSAAGVVQAGLPVGAEGDILIYHNGAWVVLPPGANGTKLTMSGGLPAWV